MPDNQIIKASKNGSREIKSIKIWGGVRVGLYNSDDTEIGTAANPIYVQAIGSGGGTPTANVNISAADGTALTETAGHLDVHVDNPITGYATEITLSAANAKLSSETLGGNAVIRAEIVDGAGAQITSFGASVVGLKNVALATINPATEDTLALIKSTDGIKKITDPVAVTTVKPDGTNTQPSLDDKTRAGFMKITDGTYVAGVDSSLNLRSGLYAFPTAGITVREVTGSAVRTRPSTGAIDADIQAANTAAATTSKVQLVQNVDDYGERYSKKFCLEVARGRISGISAVNKFGEAPEGIQLTATDVWSRANSAATQQIWLAPTAARIHAIVSSDANDDGSPVGTGARTIQVFGLPTWDLAETSEVVTMNGTGAVNTVGSYVIIHRMVVLSCGASGPNVGTITATAATDTTITAVILPGEGQTQMAIYGIPSIQTFYVDKYYFSIHENGVGTGQISCDVRFLVNPFPQLQPTVFIKKNGRGVMNVGSSNLDHLWCPDNKIPGPAIIKIQAIATVADTDASAGFDGFLINN